MTDQQTLLLCDEQGNITGHADRLACHVGTGQLHRAIHVVLMDVDGRVLLQRRKSRLWDGIWDATCATHPLVSADGHESDLRAAVRCIDAEWRARASLRERFAFVYHETDGAFAEWEFCTILTGILQSDPVLQSAYAYELAWEDAGVVAMQMGSHPAAYTPWSRIAIERLFPPSKHGHGRRDAQMFTDDPG